MNFLAVGASIAADGLPRTAYFLVHDKGMSATGEPNRARSRLHAMQFVMRDGRPTGVRVVRSWQTQYGLRDEPKQREGDRSTPEGIYRIIAFRKHRPDHLSGPWFFQLDYPNRYDRRDRRTGGAIGIHGGPNRRTLGCIRLRDQERGGRGTVAISELRSYVEIGTPLVSVPHLPGSLAGEPGVTLGEEAAEFFARLFAAPIANDHAVRLVRDFRGGGTGWVAEARDVVPETDLVTVSSELNPFGELTYRGYNLTDGDPATCWAEGAEGDGRGEWAQLRFPEPRTIDRIRVINGYARGERWGQNNRVKRASVQLSDGSTFQWRLRDTREWQEFVLAAPVRTEYVTIEVQDVYRGSQRRWRDTAISELAVGDARPGAAGIAGRLDESSAPMIARASSTLEDGGGDGYWPHNAIDGDETTCWAEGEQGLGKGEWIRISFKQPRALRQVRIINGYNRVSGRVDRWRANPRVKRVTLKFSDGTSVPWRLADTRTWQTLDLPVETISAYVQVVIDETYPGAEWEDVSISEIAFVDMPGGTPPVAAAEATQPAVVASSTLAATATTSFAPENTVDGDPKTRWAEGAEGDGRGEWIRYEFASDRRIFGIRAVNGYDLRVGSEDLWEQNARIREALVRFSDGTERVWRLADTRTPQTLPISGGIEAKWVLIVIRSTYPGRRWQDASLSEVVLESNPTTAVATPTPPAPILARATLPVEEPSYAPPTASASSTLRDPDPGRFAAVNILDGNPATCWSEGTRGDGVGEWLRIEFPRVRTVNRVRIITGYAKGDLWRKNSRPRALAVRFSDGSSFDWALQDSPEPQELALPRSVTASSVDLVIKGVIRGGVREWRDTSISEVQVE